MGMQPTAPVDRGPKPLPDTEAEKQAAAANAFMVRLSVVTAVIHGLTASQFVGTSLVDDKEETRSLAQRRVAEAAWGIADNIERKFNGG